MKYKHLTFPVWHRDEYLVIAHDAGAPREDWMFAYYQDRDDAMQSAEDYAEHAELDGKQGVVRVYKLEAKS